MELRDYNNHVSSNSRALDKFQSFGSDFDRRRKVSTPTATTPSSGTAVTTPPWTTATEQTQNHLQFGQQGFNGKQYERN